MFVTKKEIRSFALTAYERVSSMSARASVSYEDDVLWLLDEAKRQLQEKEWDMMPPEERVKMINMSYDNVFKEIIKEDPNMLFIVSPGEFSRWKVEDACDATSPKKFLNTVSEKINKMCPEKEYKVLAEAIQMLSDSFGDDDKMTFDIAKSLRQVIRDLFVRIDINTEIQPFTEVPQD